MLPMIHIHDLSSVLQNIADQKPKVRYVLAIDDSKLNLKQITKAISKQLTTGKIKNLQKEDAMLSKEISQNEFDMLTLDLRMDGAFIKEGMQIKWHCETGMIDNMWKIIKEFKTTRNLIPFKVCILGPPGVGKSTIAEQLAKEYKIHHIHLKDVITKALGDLEKITNKVDEENNKNIDEEQIEEEEEDDDDNESKVQDAAELEAIKESMENNNGRLDNLYIVKFVRQRLLSKPCQNQGFILDGFPKTEEQARDLFARNIK
jgi:adenylate kinase